MGIESDQVVYEYLSRVGDIAHQRQLPSAARMRLVSELRNEIDRHRAKVTVDSPAAVRRILDSLGTPDAVVDAAGGATGTIGGARPGQPSSPAVPLQPAFGEREPEAPRAGERRKGLRRAVPRPRSAEPAVPADAPPSPPHLAAAHELGNSLSEPDWWRVEGSPFGPAATDSVPGFVGGVEIPDMLKRPESDDKKEPGEKESGKKESAKDELAEGESPKEREPAPGEQKASRLPRRLLPRPAAGWTNPLLLLAAAALVVGAVLGNWFALLLGYLIAYGSRRLSPAETKWAVLVLPGLALGSAVVWLWGRTNGRWGAPIPQDHMNEALAQTWPWTVRGAAVASALFLLWRSQKPR
ncbi:hypothetical protein OIB37_17190 [Streptomyces sp. NBC_00820]|uniref:hypothetical protein n=1 Tax=Streptomyces sp. NBC_00820 TaxID=2975842 RepID=UPI002ED335A2|nr:hypothetical protein OIB37_17190 [Streptomyces sp. NBC_00820]